MSLFSDGISGPISIKSEVNESSAVNVTIVKVENIIAKDVANIYDEKHKAKVINQRNNKKSQKSSKIQIKLKPRRGKPIVHFVPPLLELDKHRYNVRALLRCSNATPIRTHVGSGYICCFCDAHFPKAADLKTHTIRDHDDDAKNKFMGKTALNGFLVKLDITSLSCNICSTPIDTLDQLVDHLNKSHDKKLHTDIKCHIVSFKLDDETMKCHICQFVCNNFKQLREHMNKHLTNFICDECGSGFVNRNLLRTHTTYKHHLGAYKCADCGKVFQTSAKMKAHSRIRHGLSLEIYKCYLCGDKFKSVNLKNNHVRVVHDVELAEFKCNACDRTFRSSSSLRIHKTKDHLMERRFECDLCDKRFFTLVMLKNHEITHTKIREFKCEVCTKSYTRKHGLREHMRSHTGDRRFECTHCDMTFLQKCSLKGHLRNRHDAELP